MKESESELAIGMRAGLSTAVHDAEAMLEELYDRYGRSLYRFALSILGSPEDAEDAIQEVFIRIARDYRRLTRVENVKAYLFTATRNAAYSVLRTRQRGEQLEQAVISEPIVMPRMEDVSVRSMILRTSLAELPVEQREVVMLKVYGELTFQEIADLVGDAINTIYSRYRYAVEKMKRALGEG